MSEDRVRQAGRPKILPPDMRRVYVNLSPAISAQIRTIATAERRTVTAQVELLLEQALTHRATAAA